MTTYSNTFEGGSNGTGITIGNSGGGSGDAWTAVDTSGTVQYSTTGAFHGALGMQVVAGAAATGAYWAITGSRTAAMRCYVYVTSLPGAGLRIMSFLNSGLSSNYCAIACSSAGVLSIIDNGGATVASTAGSISAGTWYRFELRVNNTTSGSQTANFDAYLGDSTSVIANLALAVNDSAVNGRFGGGNIATAYFGKQTGGTAATVYYDDCAAATSTTSYIGAAATAWTVTVTDDIGATEAGQLAEDVTVTTDVDAMGLTDTATPVKTSTAIYTQGLPPGFQVDIEFTTGTWTNVTSYVRHDSGVSLKFGRTSEFSDPQVATCAFTLDNSDGRFTPFNAGSTYYPNVTARKRVRVSYNSGSSVRYLGYIKSWTGALAGSARSDMQVTAVDRLGLLSQRILREALDEEILRDAPVAFYPMTDAAESPVALDVSGSGREPLRVVGSGPVLGDSATPPAVAATSGVAPNPTSGVSFQTDAWANAITTAASVGSGVTLELWFRTNDYNANLLTLNGPNGATPLVLSANAYTESVSGGSSFGTAQGDGQWHQIVFTWQVTSVTPTTNVGFYLNGAGGVAGLTAGSPPTITGFTLFGSAVSATNFGHIAIYPTALSAARIADHYRAGMTGFTGDLTGSRITRLALYGGLTGADVNLMPGQQTVGIQPLAGKSITSAIAELATTEGGGAAAFIDDDGRLRFVDRTLRSLTQPVLTLDAAQHINPATCSPSLDDFGAVNVSTVTREGGTPVTASNATSLAAFGTASESVSTFHDNDADALRLAQYRVGTNAPMPRFPQLTVNAYTLTDPSTFYTALPALTIGARVRVSNIPATWTVGGQSVRLFRATQADVYVEGWSETITAQSYVWTADVTPADNPARAVWDDPVYGRWQPATGTLTLTSGINNSVTSLQLSTAGSNPTVTSSAGDYPLWIQIDQEVLLISSAPGDTTSPQTFTVARGQQGTFADAHSAGAVVTGWPATTWSL